MQTEWARPFPKYSTARRRLVLGSVAPGEDERCRSPRQALGLANDKIVLPQGHHNIHLAVVFFFRIIGDRPPQRAGRPALGSFCEQRDGTDRIVLIFLLLLHSGLPECP